jgi:hypothetical protein
MWIQPSHGLIYRFIETFKKRIEKHAEKGTVLSMVLKPICSCCLGHSHLMTVFTMVSDAFQVILAVLKPIQHLGITNIRCSQCILGLHICVFNQRTPLMSQISPQGVIAFTTDFILFISPLLNQVGKSRTSSHLQLRPDQDKASSSTHTTTQSYTWSKSNIQSIIQYKQVYIRCERKWGEKGGKGKKRSW